MDDDYVSEPVSKEKIELLTKASDSLRKGYIDKTVSPNKP